MDGKEQFTPLVLEDGIAEASAMYSASSPSTGVQTTAVATASLPMVNLHAPSLTIIPVPVGPDPMRMRCYHCGADIKTATTTTHKDTAHICCLMTGSATCCLCFWIPYCCCKSFQKVDHKCPCCGSYLGTYNG